MSQERNRKSPRHKSPSRIPLPTSAVSSLQRKRPAALLTPQTPNFLTSTPSTSKVSGFKKLELLAKADARNRERACGGGHTQVSKCAIPWVDKHIPQSLDGLFVHKKKVEEVANWLSRVFSCQNANTPKICVLSGPAGCGKTAVLYLTAKSLDADVKEWINPMSLTQYRPSSDEGFRDDVQGRSQLELFSDFLFRTSQYRSLPVKGRTPKKNRVTLVEDIPNPIYRDPNVFHEILRKYSKHGISPLIFVFTDTVSGEHSLYKMFPKSLMTELNIHNISFNPVASSYMVKFLLDICSKESKPVDKGLVENIAATTNGDLRCAVNNLQFTLTKESNIVSTPIGSFRKPANKKARKPNSADSASSEGQQKDDTIQLFRALGKVLYAKREETKISENEMQLKGEMEHHRRIHPLIENPESICDKVGVTTDTFLNFLHQNYPVFYGSLEDMQHAAEYLSVGDFVVNGWKFDDSGSKDYKTREIKEQLGMSVAVRGLMHSNNNRVSVGWKPLTKPLVSHLENTTRESVKSTRESLFHLRELQSSLFTETIPFYAKIIQKNMSSKIEGKKEILEKGLFQMKSTRAVSLDEKETEEEVSDSIGVEGGDMGDVDTTELEKNLNYVENKETNALDTILKDDKFDEEFVIEEFED